MHRRPEAAGGPGVRWQLQPFAALSGAEVEALFRVRQAVFIVEQRCVYADVDGLDPGAWHLLAWPAAAGLPLACARLLSPGVKFVQPAIGRVLTHGAGRATGLGSALVARAVRACEEVWPGQGQALSAQQHLAGWYARFGFAAVGPVYDEDGIAHQDMVRPAGALAGAALTPGEVGA